jgi:hypothetical protein
MLDKIRFGAGLSWKIENSPTFIFPFRDSGAPTSPSRLDANSGRVGNESLKSAQIREGTEETILVRDTTLLIPSVIENTIFEENLLNRVKNVSDFDNSIEINDYDYIDSNICTPSNISSMKVEENYSTGFIFESNSDISIELINDLELDLDYKKLLTEYQLYDIEYDDSDNSSMNHFSRNTIIINLEDYEFVVYDDGDIKFRDDLNLFRDFVVEDYDKNLEKDLSTIKVSKRLSKYDCPDFLIGNGVELNDSVIEFLSNKL